MLAPVLAALTLLTATCLAVLRLAAQFGSPALKGRRVLFVTAHPDDEALFFAHALVAAAEQGAELHVLCLSTGVRARAKGMQAPWLGYNTPSGGLAAGNADGLGALRTEELKKACLALGVR
jgi:LmbE family N-acetylglucosaminyl deacetylase